MDQVEIKEEPIDPQLEVEVDENPFVQSIVINEEIEMKNCQEENMDHLEIKEEPIDPEIENLAPDVIINEDNAYTIDANHSKV